MSPKAPPRRGIVRAEPEPEAPDLAKANGDDDDYADGAIAGPSKAPPQKRSSRTKQVPVYEDRFEDDEKPELARNVKEESGEEEEVKPKRPKKEVKKTLSELSNTMESPKASGSRKRRKSKNLKNAAEEMPGEPTKPKSKAKKEPKPAPYFDAQGEPVRRSARHTQTQE
ncbi:hypothetical protein P7C70_g10, partial [Phenoliferia sp. Uapishka_3]